ncbi:MAG: formylglycine-generating enzyme family protein [Proteobacteria bacterium]|jgi:formylglycine-generating enzyme required for sulfatase activity|nr:formylglycine-generating enzyme family protein [Pseudomonadota bacterium]
MDTKANAAFLFFIASLFFACSSCGGDDSASDAGMDGGTDTDADSDSDADTDSDTDTDADTDTDSDSDTDTLLFDGGPLVPCENAPQEGEVCIPGGSFPMGCVPQDTECLDEENPLHVVTLSPFFIDRDEADYDHLIAWLNTLNEGYIRHPFYVETEDGKSVWHNFFVIPVALDDTGQFALCPDTINCDDVEWPHMIPSEGDWVVGGFSQYGAQLYCEAQGKTLPTEAQWEYAARGPTYLRFPYSDIDYGCGLGYLARCEDQPCYSEGWPWCLPQTKNLGSMESVFGVPAMLGNVAEWVADTAPTVTDDYSWCEDGCTDPMREGIHPIIKGGGTCTGLGEGRISSRSLFNGDIYTLTMHCAGVRCARPDEPLAPPDAGADSGSGGGGKQPSSERTRSTAALSATAGSSSSR